MEGRMSVEKTQDQALELLRRTEESVLEAARNWAGAIEDVLPVESEIAHRVATSTLDFAATVMKLHRDFVRSLMEATRPVTSQRSGHTAAHKTTGTSPRRTSAATTERRAS